MLEWETHEHLEPHEHCEWNALGMLEGATEEEIERSKVKKSEGMVAQRSEETKSGIAVTSSGHPPGYLSLPRHALTPSFPFIHSYPLPPALDPSIHT